MAHDQTLIFLHIPKTAGVTVSRTLLRQYIPDQVFHVRNPSSPRSPTFSPNHGSVEHFASLPEERRAKFRCILGHFHFGIHEHVPGEFTYFTVLRDPIERIYSQHRQYNKMVRKNNVDGQAELGLKAFCDSHPKTIDNFLIRFLCGPCSEKYTVEENLARSRNNLKNHFVLVGAQERFAESMLLLEHLMGWKDASYHDHNVSERPPEDERADPEFLAELIRINAHDQRLHADTSAALQQRIETFAGDFKKDLNKFHKRVEARRRKPADGLGVRVRRRIRRLLSR